MSDGDQRERPSDSAARPEPGADEQGKEEQRDPFGPPEVPCECFCLHCRRTFMSDQIWFQKVKGARDGFEGFWMCPTPNCSGKGFTFDIFPVDPDHPANEGWVSDDGEYYDDEDEEGEWDPESEPSNAPEGEYDPEEPKYKELDEICGDEDDDIEGEEWKYGLEPGQLPESDSPLPEFGQPGDPDEEALYNSPDQRPRELDWSDREPHEPGQFTDDDIPF
jgi:hypothetical protein